MITYHNLNERNIISRKPKQTINANEVKSSAIAGGFLLCNQYAIDTLNIRYLITLKGGEHMTIYDLIDDETRDKLNAVHRPLVKNKEQLSEREWKELMGCNRQIHKRVNGKVKRK